MRYTKDWKSWRREVRVESFYKYNRCLWTICCVCKTVTLARFPWWKRLRLVRGVAPMRSAFFRPFGVSSSSDACIWGMCSDECLNMFYLGNEDSK